MAKKNTPKKKKKATIHKPRAAKRRKSDERDTGRSLVDLEVSYRVRESFQINMARNISPGGMFIETEKPLPEGTRVELMFGTSDAERKVMAEGKVVWVSKKTKTTKAGMGIEFTRVDIEGQRYIDSLIHDFLRKVSVV